jgi:hypothetical protein
MWRRIIQWRERRRLDRVYENPRSARPRPVDVPWTRRRYRSEVVRTLAVNLGLAVLLVAGAVWLFG